MLDEIFAAMQSSAALSGEALEVVSVAPPHPGYAVMASALRENRGALFAAAALFASAFDELAAAARPEAADGPRVLRLVAS